MDRPSASVEVLAGWQLIRAIVERNHRNSRFGCPEFASPRRVHPFKGGACRPWPQVTKSVRGAKCIHNTAGEPFGAD